MRNINTHVALTVFSRTPRSSLPPPRRRPGTVSMYEQHLKAINPGVPNIQYDITDLFAFMDTLGDICCLEWSGSISAFLPRDREWMKQAIFTQFKQQSQGPATRSKGRGRGRGGRGGGGRGRGGGRNGGRRR